MHAFTAYANGQKAVDDTDLTLDSPEITGVIGDELYEKLLEDVELLDGASNEFNIKEVTEGKLSPVFFGSALTNFGIELFLNYFLEMTSPHCQEFLMKA